MLTDEQRAAFASLRKVWPRQRIILIGAGALRLQKRLARVTADLDIAVAVELSDYAGTFLADAGLRPDPKQPQRWTHGNGVQLDILPAGQDLRARGHIEWPNAHRMSIEGFDALFSTPLPLADADLRIELATVPLIVLLKMVAWLDRPADRSRDLHDLAYLFTDYLDENNDADFARILDAIQQGYVEHQTAHAFLLGQDVARCEGAPDVAHRFVDSLSNAYRWMLGVMQRGGPAALSRDEAFDAAWTSFLRGLGLASARS